MAQKNKKLKPPAQSTRAAAQKLANELSRLDLREYVRYLRSPGKIVRNNILAGVARGFGWVVGATLVVTIVTLVISHLTGIPIIGQFFVWLKETLGAR